MYYFLYTSSDYYEPDINQEQSVDKVEVDNVCLICWLPNNTKTPVKNMKEFTFIITSCDCNALFHDKCLNQWLTNSTSCPICRKIVIKNTIQNCPNYIIIKGFIFYFFFFNYTSVILQITNFISIINLFIFYIYTIFIFYHFGNAFHEEIIM
jgi:hypothetical protein